METLDPRLMTILEALFATGHAQQRGWSDQRVKAAAQQEFRMTFGAAALAQHQGTKRAWKRALCQMRTTYFLPRAIKELTEMGEQIVFEVTALQAEFIRTDFFGNTPHFPYAHYGYMMVILSQIDLLSRYWAGGDKVAPYHGPDGQTTRMHAFMKEYVDPGKPAEHSVVIQYWRHTLMHTGQPRSLYDAADTEYSHHIRFDREMPAEQHYTLMDHGGVKVIALDILRFATDLRRAIGRYVDDLQARPELQAHYRRADTAIRRQQVVVRTT